MDLSLRSIKTNNWSADDFKKRRHLNELYTWEHELYNGQRILFLTAVNWP